MIDASSLHLVAIDLETTGLDPARCDVVEVGWQHVVAGELSGPTRARMIRPAPAPSPPTTRDLDSDLVRRNVARLEVAMAPQTPRWELARRLSAVLAEMYDDTRQVHEDVRPLLCFHNAPFDMAFLGAACTRRDTSARTLIVEAEGPFSRRVVDTQALALPFVLAGHIRSASLASLCELCGVRPGDHTAGEDARATAELAVLLLTHWPRLPPSPSRSS